MPGGALEDKTAPINFARGLAFHRFYLFLDAAGAPGFDSRFASPQQRPTR
eukprot:COSAG04_NODE_5098_length_1739_cov_0.887195_3_plen_49_part_01